jgi:glycosyltransferase involved in cell wall biosynthesis
VITPCLNGLAYLRKCAASVADQRGILTEHIVMDAGSTDGTLDWLKSQPSVRWLSEKDRGMYDAVNKGWKQARGRILSYLNCDEQYLPGTLAAVREVFDRHPEVDLVFGDALLIRSDGSLLAFRKAYPLRWWYIPVSHLYVLSCAMFVRRRLVDEGLLFDTQYRDVGDADFAIRVLKAGYKAQHLKRYLSAFTMTGSNMSLRPNARQEWARLIRSAPFAVRSLRPIVNGLRYAEKVLAGAYADREPIEYAVYGEDPSAGRLTFRIERSTWRWTTQ